MAIVGGSFYLHKAGVLNRMVADPVLLASWVVTLLFIVTQLVLAWSQKPLTASRGQQEKLDRLYVSVVIPCYNEDPQILDRTIVSLMRQTRLPNHVEIVDDGSTVDYAQVRDFWLAHHPPGVRFTWVRQRNAGKKHAQAVTFTTDHDAQVFVTIDSDSALDRRAIDEGLKPFADPRVVSVAGLETAINIDRNLLTRAIGHRSLVFQLFAMSAQSVARGSVLINPGAFSLYWAPLIRKIVPAYLGETFCGIPVTLGDDTALTMYALLHGRAVHQPTAVSLPVYPETLAHHLRQWTRWMRASTIRMLWRLRYLPVVSYGWIFTAYTIGSFLTSVAISLAIPLTWPGSKNLLLASLGAMVLWPLSISLRLATIRRSDQGTLSRLVGVALLPAAALWYLLVLRQIRFYGIATCWRQGWVTRQHVEVRLDGSHEPAGGQAPMARETAGGMIPHGPRGLPAGRAAQDRRAAGRDGQDGRDGRDGRDGQDGRTIRDPRRAAHRGTAQQPRVSQVDWWGGPGSTDRRDSRDPRQDPRDRRNGRDVRVAHDQWGPWDPRRDRPAGLAQDRGARSQWPAQDPRVQSRREIGLARDPGDPRPAREPQPAGHRRPEPRLDQDPRFAGDRQPPWDPRLAWDRQPPWDPRLARDARPADSRQNGLSRPGVRDDWAALDWRSRADSHDHRRDYSAEPGR